RGFTRAPVELCHQKILVPLHAAESAAHAALAFAVVIAPAIVEEGYAELERAPNDAGSLRWIRRKTKVITAQTDGRDLFAGPTQLAIHHNPRSVGLAKASRPHRPYGAISMRWFVPLAH